MMIQPGSDYWTLRQILRYRHRHPRIGVSLSLYDGDYIWIHLGHSQWRYGMDHSN